MKSRLLKELESAYFAASGTRRSALKVLRSQAQDFIVKLFRNCGNLDIAALVEQQRSLIYEAAVVWALDDEELYILHIFKIRDFLDMYENIEHYLGCLDKTLQESFELNYYWLDRISRDWGNYSRRRSKDNLEDIQINLNKAHEMLIKTTKGETNERHKP